MTDDCENRRNTETNDKRLKSLEGNIENIRTLGQMAQ